MAHSSRVRPDRTARHERGLAPRNVSPSGVQGAFAFYAQAKPGLPPFVTVGSRVTPSTVVCIVEAMKVLNEIPADCSGVIAEICVENGDPVEFKTVLFRVDPAG